MKVVEKAPARPALVLLPRIPTCPSIIHALVQILDSYFFNGLSSLSQKLHATQKTQLTTHNPHKYHANANDHGRRRCPHLTTFPWSYGH